MTVDFYPASTSAQRIEDILYNAYDGSCRIVAVEVFDHPESEEDRSLGATIGPWFVGPESDVYAYLEEHDFQEYDEQYSSPPPVEEPSDDRE